VDHLSSYNYNPFNANKATHAALPKPQQYSLHHKQKAKTVTNYQRVRLWGPHITLSATTHCWCSLYLHCVTRKYSVPWF